MRGSVGLGLLYLLPLAQSALQAPVAQAPNKLVHTQENVDAWLKKAVDDKFKNQDSGFKADAMAKLKTAIQAKLKAQLPPLALQPDDIGTDITVGETAKPQAAQKQDVGVVTNAIEARLSKAVDVVGKAVDVVGKPVSAGADVVSKPVTAHVAAAPLPKKSHSKEKLKLAEHTAKVSNPASVVPNDRLRVLASVSKDSSKTTKSLMHAVDSLAKSVDSSQDTSAQAQSTSAQDDDWADETEQDTVASDDEEQNQQQVDDEVSTEEGGDSSSNADEEQEQQEADDDQDDSETASSSEDSSQNEEEQEDNGEEEEAFLQKPRQAPVMLNQWPSPLDDDAHPLFVSHVATGRSLRGSRVHALQSAADDLSQFIDSAMVDKDESDDTEDLEKETLALKKDVQHQLDAGAAPAPAKGGAPGPSPGPAPGPAVEKDLYKLCDEMCKHDTGMDGDLEYCLVDCHSYVDAGGDIDSLMDFVTDETYNEQGGEKMEDKFESMTGKDIPDCKPSIPVEKVPSFDSVDTDEDGQISKKEVEAWGLKACVPNELVQQIFDIADSNYDAHVSHKEWKAIGENTDIEQVLDTFTDKLTRGEDQYEPVQLPAFRHLDVNSDEELDADEIMKLFKDEIKRRIPTMSSTDVDAMAKQYEDDILRDVMKLDLNGDQRINAVEFDAPVGGGMGKELYEAAQNPNNLPDPDDLSRTPGGGAPAPGPAAPNGLAPAPAAYF